MEKLKMSSEIIQVCLQYFVDSVLQHQSHLKYTAIVFLKNMLQIHCIKRNLHLLF